MDNFMEQHADVAIYSGSDVQPMSLISLTFEIPLPPKGCKPGSGGHWRTRARAVKGYREIACVKALCASKSTRPSFALADIKYEFFLGGRGTGVDVYRPRDDDNARACMKAAQDGFVDAGILKGDTAKNVRVSEVVFHRTAKEHQGKSFVRVTIQNLEAMEDAADS